MKRQNFVCVLDIGSTKICCCIANRSNNNIDIKGLGYCACTGIVSGVIVEMDSVCKSVATAIEMAEAQSKSRVKSVYVSISGKTIKSYIEKYTHHIGGRLINKHDIIQMLRQNNEASENHVILHKMPIIFGIDGLNNIRSPLGMLATDLSAQVSIMTAPRAQVDNLLVCLSKCHLDIRGIVESHYASGLALIDENADNEKINLIEIGGSSTALSFWYNGAFCGMNIIPIGGGHITNDLTNGFGVSYADAERLKVLYGAAIPATYENDSGVITAVIDNIDSIQMQQISKGSVNKIVQPCIEKLANLISDVLKSSPFSDFSKSTILTGGSSQFPGISDLLSLLLQKNVYHKKFENIKNFDGSEFTQNYATMIGLLKYAIQEQKDENEQNIRHKSFDFENIFPYFSRLCARLKEIYRVR